GGEDGPRDGGADHLQAAVPLALTEATGGRRLDLGTQLAWVADVQPAGAGRHRGRAGREWRRTATASRRSSPAPRPQEVPGARHALGLDASSIWLAHTRGSLGTSTDRQPRSRNRQRERA